MFTLYYKLSKTPPILCCVHAKSLQSCSILYIQIDCSLPDSSVHEIFQARLVDYSWESSQPRDLLHFLHWQAGSLPLAPPGMLLLLLLSKTFFSHLENLPLPLPSTKIQFSFKNRKILAMPKLDLFLSSFPSNCIMYCITTKLWIFLFLLWARNSEHKDLCLFNFMLWC